MGEDGGEFGFDEGEVVGVLVDGGAFEEEGFEGALDELHGGGLAEGEGFGGGRGWRGGGRGRQGDYVFTFVLFEFFRREFIVLFLFDVLGLDFD